MIYQWKDGIDDKYIVCETNARLDRTTNEKESVFVKDIKGIFLIINLGYEISKNIQRSNVFI